MNIPEKDFAQLVDHLQAGICRVTVNVRPKFIYANQTFLEMFGLSRTDLPKLRLNEIFDEKNKFHYFTSRLAQDGMVNKFDVRLKNKKRGLFWCTVSGILVTGSKDKPQYCDIVISDISKRKQTERELRESKDLFQTLFNSTAAAITVTDKNETIIAWNSFAEKMLGMDKKELFNKSIKDLYPPEEWKRMRALRIRRKGIVSNIETKVIRKDKTLLDASVSVSVLNDAEGNLMGTIGIIHDISQQKTAERKIKDSENKIRVILDNSAAAITLIDAEERIVSWNKFTEQLLGMSADDLLNKPVSMLYPKEEWQKIRSENIRNIGSKHHLETKILTKDGRILDADLSINVLRDSEGKIVGSVGIMQDITKQKRTLEMLIQAKLAAEESSSAKSLFLANMSHEFRTPMNAIIGMIDMTLETALDAEQKDNLQVAKDAAGNLLSLLNDILDLSRVEAGKIVLENIEFNLVNVVHNIVKGLSVIARNKGLELVIKTDPEVPEMLVGDPVRLRQVLINLINNAIKFTHSGKIEIGVKMDTVLNHQVVMRFSVKDQGIGISKEQQEKIFDPFTQADTSTSRRFGGTGLGLAICKRLVEMMQGRIWTESVVNKGSTFFFTATFTEVDLPRNKVRESSQQQKQPLSDIIEEELSDLKILLAEDNAVNQKITSRLLEKQGWHVEVVENGNEVIEKVTQHNYDLVLMDAQMPILDGLEATKIIRENELKTGQHVPIIALTARAMQEDKQKCLDSGMDGFVTKPIEREKLLEEIVNILKKGRPHE